MRKTADYRNLAFNMFKESANRGLMHARADDTVLDGRSVSLQGRSCIHFGSCSYLGLETHPKLKQGVIEAVERYGTQFSSSRGTMSSPGYETIEALLSEMFGCPALLAPTTSLAHIAAFPVLANEDDAFIVDQQAHHSLQTATHLIRSSHVELIRHSRMDLLEQKILELRGRYRRVWYVADGIYSMLGDPAPMAHLTDLLQRYRQFHLYIDDAHGMGWSGKYGRGYVLDKLPMHERMIVSTSLAKAFGVGGGVLLIPDEELRARVRMIGGPFVFSGPIQPPMLGAAIASARIHLSDELPPLQAALLSRIRFANALLREAGLPVVAPDDTPIRFIGTGLPRVTFNLGERLLNAGFYLLAAHFPVVPMKRSGLRFTITLHHSMEDIRALVDALAQHLPLALAEEGYDRAAIDKAFDLPTSEPGLESRGWTLGTVPAASLDLTVRPAGLHLEHFRTIDDLDASEWDGLLGDRGSFTASGLSFLESVFKGHALPEHNWAFHYYIVRDEANVPVLATFFSEALWKDDMIAREDVSRALEERRRNDRYHLTSTYMAMGSLLTEGNHLYLDRTADWRTALSLLLEGVQRQQEEAGASAVVLRDLPGEDAEMDAFLLDQGFAKHLMPESYELACDWVDAAAYEQTLSRRDKRHQRQQIQARAAGYELEVLNASSRGPTPEEFARIYELNRNVQARAFMINTFPAPPQFFARVLAEPNWEILLLRLRPEFGGPADGRPVAIGVCYVGARHYVPLEAGLDYDYVESHGAYRLLLHHVILRARALGKNRITFGMGAGLEKKRFGATPHAKAIYLQASDHFPMDVIARMMEEGGIKKNDRG